MTKTIEVKFNAGGKVVVKFQNQTFQLNNLKKFKYGENIILQRNPNLLNFITILKMK
jgi:hypothetical protein